MLQAWQQAEEPRESLSTALIETQGPFGDRWLTEWRKLTGHRSGDYQYRSAYAAYKKGKFVAARKTWKQATNIYMGKRVCKGTPKKKAPKKKGKKTGKKGQKGKKGKKADRKAKKQAKKKVQAVALAALKEARLARAKAAPVEEISVAGIC